MCEDHLTEFDVIEYDLEYVCPECKNKDYAELKKLNDMYMKLCEVGERLQKKIAVEIERLNAARQNVENKALENGN